MLRILLSLFTTVAACNPASEDVPMTHLSHVAESDAPASGAERKRHPIVAQSPIGSAAQAAIPEPVLVAEDQVPASTNGSAAEALGRRVLSTAFVRVGAGERLTVELHDGRVLALRDVVMRPVDFCGFDVSRGEPGKTFCGRYGMVATARPTVAIPIEPVDGAPQPLPPGRHHG